MHTALKEEGIGNAVMEIFSKPRVSGMAERLGIMPGASHNFAGLDPDDGMPCEFNSEEKRKKALDMIISKKALLLIGSPMCRAFSRLQNWNFKKMSTEKKEHMMKEGRTHLKFCMMLYKIQIENGMYFLHEHPYSATSWKEPAVQEVLGIPGVKMVRGDMCAFRIWQDTVEGRKLQNKATGYIPQKDFQMN